MSELVGKAPIMTNGIEREGGADERLSDRYLNSIRTRLSSEARQAEPAQHRNDIAREYGYFYGYCPACHANEAIKLTR